tara:strand:+ start:327 stop:623 length:297 start_codon:yes stop_codon:yes gene_type:complete
MNFNAAKIKQLMARLDKVIGFNVDVEEIEKQEREMLRLSKPNLWNVHLPHNMELEMETQFEQWLFEIQEHTKEDLDKITVFRFYSLLDYIKNKNNSDG